MAIIRSTLKSHRAFTLIELLVALTIMAIIASVSVGYIIHHYENRPEPLQQRVLTLYQALQQRATSSGAFMAITIDDTHLTLWRFNPADKHWQITKTLKTLTQSLQAIQDWEISSSIDIDGNPAIILTPSQINYHFSLHKKDMTLRFNPSQDSMELTHDAT